MKKPSKTKKRIEDSYIQLADIIDGRPHIAGNGFPVDFHKAKMDDGNYIILRQTDDTGTVVASKKKELAYEVMRYARDHPSYGIKDDKDAMRVVEWWLATGRDVPMPPPFVWLDESGLSFSRLPWVKGISGPTPTWDKLGERMTNFKAFMMFIGSLLDSEAKHQQYVWCHGGGGNGKSAIDRVLERIFSTAYRSAFPPKDRVGFWLRSLIGKKLVVFPDCNARGFPASGLFKGLCANDAVETEEKGGATVSMRLGCRFVFMSNELPDLSSEEADSRRVIFCNLGKPSDSELRPSFETDLWDEAGYFISKCHDEWMSLVIDGKTSIPTESDEIFDIVRDNEMHHEKTLQLYFVIDKSQKSGGITPLTLQNCLELSYKERRDQREFRQWLNRVHGITKRQLGAGEQRGMRYYQGLFLKTGGGDLDAFETVR